MLVIPYEMDTQIKRLMVHYILTRHPTLAQFQNITFIFAAAINLAISSPQLKCCTQNWTKADMLITVIKFL